MERTKYLLIAMLFFTITSNANPDYKSIIYKAYISNDMSKWKVTMDEMNLVKDKSHDFILELINYQYGYIGLSLGNKKETEARHYINLARKNIQVLQAKSYKLSYVNAYMAALYGFEMGLNNFKAPFIGPKSIKCAELAMELDKTNPYGYIQFGNSQYYMPPAFGGSKTVAIEYYLKAEKLMELNKEQIKDDWNYLSLQTAIAQAYEETGKWGLAKLYYEKILKIEPDYSWVKNELYPAILKK